LADTNLLSHALQQGRAYSTTAAANSSSSSSSSLGRSTLAGRTLANGGGGAGGAAFSGRRRFSSVATKAAEEARRTAMACGYTDFEAWLTAGGDDRSIIKQATGANKYHIQPRPVDPDHVFRGSCTGNPPTARGYGAAKKLYDDVLSGLQWEELDLALRDVYAEQRTRISSMLELPEGAEVILCPSGSDAEYIPLAIARALRSDAKITNGITQLREIGAGSAPAAVGKFFSTHAPLLGELPEDLEYLAGFEGIDGVTISARDKDGSVVDAVREMDEFADHAFRHGWYPIIHGVFGGKTGLRDGKMPGSTDGGSTALGVVDACQGRFTLDELKGWLEQDSVVLFTASKFYQAPPFCAAVIVPPAIAEKLRKVPAPRPREMFGGDGLGAFLTDKELSRCLSSWKPLLRSADANNVGLALRWEAGLAGMEALASTPDHDRTVAVEEWASAVTDMVNTQSALDAWCVERSIVSIRVAKEGGWLNMSELRDLYRWMSMDVSGVVPDATNEEKAALSKPAYIGQPVDVSDTHAIVRIALGVESLLSYLDGKEQTLNEDQATVRKLAAISKFFNTLKESGL